MRQAEQSQAETAAMGLKPNAVVFFSTLLLWLLLKDSLTAEAWISGVVVALVVTIVTRRNQLFDAVIISFSAPLALLKYLLHFFITLVQANLDMGRRVLTPSLPIEPEVVEVQTSLQSNLGRLLLANSITLTPGTLTVDVIDDRLIVHWVDCRPGADLQSATRAIAAGFEKNISGFLK